MGDEPDVGGNSHGIKERNDSAESPEGEKGDKKPSSTQSAQEAYASQAEKEAAASPTPEINKKIHNLPLIGSLLTGS